MREPLSNETYLRGALVLNVTEASVWNSLISRLLKIIGLFCRIQSLLYVSFAKENYNLKEPTNRSHPITSKTGISSLYIQVYRQMVAITCLHRIMMWDCTLGDAQELFNM